MDNIKSLATTALGAVLLSVLASPAAADPDLCDVPSSTPSPQQVARVDYGDSRKIVTRKLGTVGTLAFRGTRYATYDYGIADCAPGFATVTYGRWQGARRVVAVEWRD